MKKMFKDFKKFPFMVGKLVITLLVGCIIFTGCSSEILPPHPVSTATRKYVSIGDSIAAGYGLADYQNDGNRTVDSYAYLFSQQSKIADYVDLATSGFDTNDILENIDTYIESGAFENVSVITLAIGSNDILQPSLNMIRQAGGVDTNEQLIKKLTQLNNSNKKLELLYLLGSIYNSLTSEQAKNIFENQVEQYKTNIITIIDKLANAAIDAKIYLINYYNPYAQLAFGSLNVGSIVATYLDEMNNFVSNHQYAGYKYFVVDISDMDSNYTNVSLDTSNMALDPHPNAAGHKLISEKVWDSYSTYNEAAAIVEYLDGSLEKEYYNSAALAWNKANTIIDKDIKITLLKDWISDNDYKMGTGAGFDTSGTIKPVNRKNKNSQLVLDLNNHVVDRCLTTTISGGEVFEIRKDGTFTIKNGTITGGDNKGNSGAIWVDNDETTLILENLVITGNKTVKNGGGVYIKDCQATIDFINCTIVNNTSTEGYGGGIYFSDGPAKVTISGKMVIANNTAKSKRENLTVQRTGWFNTGYPTIWVGVLEEGSQIYFNVSSNELTRSVFYVDEKVLSKQEAFDQYTKYFINDGNLKMSYSDDLDGSKKYHRYALDLD